MGIDRRSLVSWDLFTRRGSFPYTDTIGEVRYRPGEYAPDSEELGVEELRAIGLALE